MCTLATMSHDCFLLIIYQLLIIPDLLQTHPKPRRQTTLHYSRLVIPTLFSTITMTGTSSVGPISVNGAGDQRNVKNSEVEQPERYEEGKVNSHDTNDSSKTHFPGLLLFV